MFISQEASPIFPNLNCVFMYEKAKFPPKFQNFPPIINISQEWASQIHYFFSPCAHLPKRRMSSLIEIKVENKNYTDTHQSVITWKSGRVYCRYCIDRSIRLLPSDISTLEMSIDNRPTTSILIAHYVELTSYLLEIACFMPIFKKIDTAVDLHMWPTYQKVPKVGHMWPTYQKVPKVGC